jgi:hypothetical protein
VIAGDCGNSRPSASSTGGRVLGLERLAQAGVRGPVSLYGIPRSAGALFKHRKAGTGDGMKKAPADSNAVQLSSVPRFLAGTEFCRAACVSRSVGWTLESTRYNACTSKRGAKPKEHTSRVVRKRWGMQGYDRVESLKPGASMTSPPYGSRHIDRCHPRPSSRAKKGRSDAIRSGLLALTERHYLRTGASGRARSRNNRPGRGSLTSGRRLAAARRPARPA